jgi:ketol-acid reductoisomerase
MASRQMSRALRSPLTKQIAAPAARRTFVSAVNAAGRRPAAKAAVAVGQQVRGVKTIDFAGTKEKVFGKSTLNWCLGKKWCCAIANRFPYRAC